VNFSKIFNAVQKLSWRVHGYGITDAEINIDVAVDCLFMYNCLFCVDTFLVSYHAQCESTPATPRPAVFLHFFTNG